MKKKIPIEGCEYYATEEGFIYNRYGKQLTGTISNTGYIRIHIVINGIAKQVAIHRLIALTFIPNDSNLPQVNHKNGIKTDNRMENLEWCSQSENMKHAYNTGLQKPIRNLKHGLTKLSDKTIIEIRKLYATGKYKQIKISEMYGICHQHVSDIINFKKRILD